MLALAIEFSRCSRWLAPRELNSVPGRRGTAPRPFHFPKGTYSGCRAGPFRPSSQCDRPRCFAGSTRTSRFSGMPKLLRKEVIQPHLPVRLPCYDFTPIADPTFDGSLQMVGPPASGVTDFRGVTGGVYKARERIHRSIADLRLLATPTSRGRVADPDPN